MRAAIFVAVAYMAVLSAGCGTSSGPRDGSAYGAVVASPVRMEQDLKTDTLRKPAQFLSFTGVRPGMRVLDVSAGGGYTTQLLALAVGDAGRVWAQVPRAGAALTRRLAEHPQPNIVVVERPFDDPVPGDARGLDLVTIVLNYHDITYLPVDRAAMNKRLFAALKPGGRLVVVDHSARPGTGIADGKTLHRIDEAVVRDELAQAGFVLDAEGAFLRNPADARDDPSGAPRVPTDRFALRFVRPAP
ncbi:MAG: SAM-dependent methyltransferase [Betaproteobacteria bacterium]